MDEIAAQRQERQRIGDSFAALKGSEAWAICTAWLTAECERSKGKAVLAAAEKPTSEVRNLLIAWQEREKLTIGLLDLIDEGIENRDNVLEELQDERRSDGTDPTANW